MCNFREKLLLHDVFRVIKLLLYSVPEHRKKVKKNCSIYTVRPCRPHSGRTMSSRILRTQSLRGAFSGKLGMSLQMHPLSVGAYCRDSSGLPEIVINTIVEEPLFLAKTLNGYHISWQFWFALLTIHGNSPLYTNHRTVHNLWITVKRLTFDSKYVNIMLMIH